MLSLTRKYTFSAAHRLWDNTLSDAENLKYFGPCSNIHGHNYTLEVSVSGKPSPKTGMIMDIVLLDEIVQKTLLSFVDHRSLDEDVPFLRGILSTVENVSQVFYDQLAPHILPPARLHRICLYESDRNWVSVTDEKGNGHE